LEAGSIEKRAIAAAAEFICHEKNTHVYTNVKTGGLPERITHRAGHP